MKLSRRQTLQLGFGAFLGAGCAHDMSQVTGLALSEPPKDFPVKGQLSLKQRAAAKGIIFGAAGNYQALTQDTDYAQVFAENCGMLVPENELKWAALRPSPDRFDFTSSDWLAQFAKQHGMLFRGHTLVWNQSNPEWLKDTTAQNAEQVLIKHIDTVVKHYAGRIHSWDVVNEAIAADWSKRDDRLHFTTQWFKLLDKNYIDIAFKAAGAADPNAMLVYNDGYLNYDTPHDNEARAAVLKLLEWLKSRNAPIHALGVQGHLDAADKRFNQKKFRDFLSEVAGMGLKILLTELDVSDRYLPADLEVRDRAVAQTYEEYLSVALDERAVIAVLTWGMSDRYTWLTNYSPRSDKLPVRVLPYGADLRRKLAWNAIARAFDAAPKR
ncbi:endo-1,4-beta-xylanase [Leptolyngbya sp. NIES-2104]|uniref:endo-1,4-beta-xylanase n=1 Tax=Leptolyngbya sp. NIES-2104 TaxID=1552121 RepID=UPI0006EC78D9|nr:endo-1,4-beta-xylanase [Leptolyngbya sp. NIES-2104]GAP94687.1 endo-1,4-beta-xylanase A precursor [Leptolyngbya sp. NIES-2104]